ncbi:hypothetical protein P3H15_22775 [Rhodococcus sp. T2V]|nr:hypothetical protein [Rhodococcus sp. T2V]MDF3307851.1 hypothetical protein [Rhodococcus sp. T2V]
MTPERRIPIPTDTRLELLLAFVGIIALIGLYAATLGVLRLAVALGWYVS